MAYQTDKLEKLVTLVEQHSQQEGVNLTRVESLGTFKASTTQGRSPAVDQPAIVIVGQGEKHCYVGNKKFDYSVGNALVMFYPMPVEVEIVKASPDKPFLAAGVRIDLGRMADVLLRIDRIEGAVAKPDSVDPSGLFSVPLNDRLLDPTIRLFESLANPRDAAMLGDAIVDEIYYRVLCDERGGALRILLQQRGQIQRISKAAAYIHRNLDKPVSVEQLADMVYMSRTSFYENFRDVMHLSPLQYAKSVKLHKAQALIQEGKNASEAGYLVGYNSPSQFSREYKRHFGFAPSATV
jgi:AraC-like DNA-binding protein